MVKVYANLVIAGRRTIDEVPGTLRAAVEALLAEMGYTRDAGGGYVLTPIEAPVEGE